MIPERQPALVEAVCRRGGGKELRAVWEPVLRADGYRPELRRQALEWLTDAAGTRKVKPSGNLSGIGQLLKESETDKDPTLLRDVVRLAGAWKVTALAKEFRQLALSDKEEADVRQAALEGLASLGDKTSRHTIEELTAPQHPVQVRFLAATALLPLDLDAAATAGTAALADATAQDEPGS